MIIQFKTHDVTFFDEDKAYFEKRLNDVERFLGNHAGDEDSTKVHVDVSKDKHSSGNRFHAKAHMSAPNGADFVAETDAENIHALADNIKDILERQARKFHTKNSK